MLVCGLVLVLVSSVAWKCSVSGSYCWLRYGCGGWIWSEAVDCVVSVVVFNIIGGRTLEIEFW